MSKLLKLNITDEELRSSHPPKPPSNAWEQFMPDIKMGEGQLADRLDSPVDQIEGDNASSVSSQPMVGVGESVIREVSKKLDDALIRLGMLIIWPGSKKFIIATRLYFCIIYPGSSHLVYQLSVRPAPAFNQECDTFFLLTYLVFVFVRLFVLRKVHCL